MGKVLGEKFMHGMFSIGVISRLVRFVLSMVGLFVRLVTLGIV